MNGKSSLPQGAVLLCAATMLAAANVSAITLPTGFTEFPVASGISNPTAMAFAPDGRLFVCEQGGRLRVIRDGALLATPFLTVGVNSSGERGLLGVAFDPDFANNQLVYIYYTPTTPNLHRVSRFVASGDVAGGSEQVIFTIPDASSASNHNGGAIKFSQDGKLLIAVGERAQPSNAQTTANLLGKMLRINPDGSIPSDNPFFATASGDNRAIWILGLRNPFTFDVHPTSGRTFVNDVGAGTWEEINDVVRGANYGWPTTEGATTDPRFRTPLYSYSHSEGCAIVGAAFYAPPVSHFPASFTDTFFFADLCSNWIRYYNPANGNVTTFGTQTVGTPVDLEVGPDGNLYYAARSGGVIRRIAYTAGSAPVISTPPASQTVALDDPVTFSVTASGTSPLAYQWQRNGTDILGATASTYSIPMATMTDNGARFRCRVSNSFGSVTSAEGVLTVLNNRRPQATIDTPVTGTLYNAGNTINFAGTGSDSEDGPLGGAAFTWQVDFHHDTHTHPHMPATTGATGGSFTVPVLGETSTNVWFRIHLSVTDSAGLVRNVFRDVRPRVTRLTLATNASGTTVSVDGATPQTAPYSFDSVTGMTRSIGTAVNQTVSSGTWSFVSWSDGGAATHNITVPASPATITATFRQIILPGQPTLISPSGNITTTTPTYRWNPVAEATEYEIWVGDTVTAVINTRHPASVCSATQCSITPTTTLGSRAYTWWIQARNAAGGGPWSAGMNFSTVVPMPGVPTPVSPSGAISTATPTYTWNAVANATEYDLWVGDASTALINATYPASTACPTSTCSVTPSTALMNRGYTWWLRARNSAGTSAWSSGLSFTVTGGATPTPRPTPGALPAQATLVSPNGTVTTATPTYTWNVSANATEYQLWVGDASVPVINTTHQASVVCPASGTTCSVTPSTALMNRGYSWWVLARNASGAAPWSAGMSFTVNTTATPTPTPTPGGSLVAPTLNSPNGTIMTQNPTYTWNAVTNATDYQLWVGDASAAVINSSHQASAVCTSGVCSVTPSTRLTNRACTWWVQARSGSGMVWSTGMNFTVSAGSPPAQATLVSPSGTGSRTPTYTWNAVSGTLDYYLWVENSGAVPVVQQWLTGSTVCPSSGTTCSFTPGGTLAAGSHTWWIQTRNNGGTGPWSAPRSFVAQ